MKLWMQVVCRTATALLVAALMLGLTGSFWWALVGFVGAGVVINLRGGGRSDPRGAC